MALPKTSLSNTFCLIMAITTFTILLQSMTSVNDIAFAQVRQPTAKHQRAESFQHPSNDIGKQCEEPCDTHTQ